MDLLAETADGGLRIVVSDAGAVKFDGSVRLPHRPGLHAFAIALRVLADSLDLADERAQRRGEAR